MTELALKLVPPKPDPKIVETLEEILVKAEKGEVFGMAYLYFNRGTGYTLGTIGDGMSAFEAAGALQKLALELLNSI